jgi:hypothetical protein
MEYSIVEANKEDSAAALRNDKQEIRHQQQPEL